VKDLVNDLTVAIHNLRDGILTLACRGSSIWTVQDIKISLMITFSGATISIFRP